MRIEDPLSMMRQLKGAPLSILVVLSITNQPAQAKWLSTITGYSDNTISRALVLLKGMQIITCDSHRSNWRLTNDVLQLPLAPQIPDRKNRDPEATTTTLNKKKVRNFNVAEEELNNSDRNNRDPDRKNRDPDFQKKRDLLYQAGIGEPTLTEILNLDYLTLEYVLAHTTFAIVNNDDRVALLIHRLRSRDVEPRVNSHGHAIGCVCDTCDPYKPIHCMTCFEIHYPPECEEE